MGTPKSPGLGGRTCMAVMGQLAELLGPCRGHWMTLWQVCHLGVWQLHICPPRSCALIPCLSCGTNPSPTCTLLIMPLSPGSLCTLQKGLTVPVCFCQALCASGCCVCACVCANVCACVCSCLCFHPSLHKVFIACPLCAGHCCFSGGLFCASLCPQIATSLSVWVSQVLCVCVHICPCLCKALSVSLAHCLALPSVPSGFSGSL